MCMESNVTSGIVQVTILVKLELGKGQKGVSTSKKMRGAISKAHGNMRRPLNIAIKQAC